MKKLKFNMKIAILVAMDKELKLLLNLMPERKEVDLDGALYYVGKIGDKDIVAGKCGIGKVNSALRTQSVIRSIRPDLVINTGVAGGAGNGLSIGDLLIADCVSYHDVWCGPGTEYGAADGLKASMLPDMKALAVARKLFADAEGVEFGLICSGDKFISRADEVSVIKSYFPVVKAVDMESASIAQTCILEHIPFIIMRVVSDTPGEGENIEQYQDFWSKAPEKTFKAVEKLVEKL